MAPQNPRDMRDYLRTLERGTSQNRSMAAVVGEAIKEIEKDRENENSRRPAPPIELDAQTAYYDDLDLRRKRVRLSLDFPDVIFHTDGSRATIQQYELWGRAIVAGEEEDEDRPWQLRAANPESYFRSEGYIPGARWVFRVRAIGVDAVQPGEWSEEITVQMVKDSTPPPQPSAPVVESSRGQLIITWDGLAVSGPMPADTSYVILAHGTASSPTKEYARFGPEGGLTVYTGAAYMVPQFFRLRAVDESGQLGPWSEQVTGITKPLVDTDIIISELDAARTTIINAGEILLDRNTKLVQRLAAADAALETVREYAEEQSAELDARIDDNQSAIQEAERKLTGPGGLTERITGAETKLSDVGALTYAAGQTLRQKLTASDAAITAATNTANTLKNTTIPKLNTDLAAATGRLTTAEGEIDAAQGEITSTKTELTAAKKQITDNKVITDAAAIRLGTAEGEITAAKGRLTTAETNINTLRNTTFPNLDAGLAAAVTRITAAEAEIDTAQADITDTNAELVAAKQTIATNQATMDGAITRLGTAEGEITSAKSRLTTAETAVNTLKDTTVPKLTTDLAAATGRITGAEHSLTLIPGNIQAAKDAAIAAAYAEAAAKAEAARAAAVTAAAADAKTKADNALAAALGSGARGASAVLNGSFEQGFTGWELENTADPTTYGIDSTVARTGSKSFWTAGRGGFRQQAIPVVAGQTWEAALWYKTEATYSNSNAGGLRLQAHVNGTWSDVASSTLRVNADWTRSFVRYLVPANVTQMRIRFAFNYTGAAKAWVDDIELVNVTAELAAAADATAKADAALSAASSQVQAARTEALDAARAAAGLAGSMGRSWFQPTAPPTGIVYDWTGKAFESPSTARDSSGAVVRTNMAVFSSPGVVGWGHRTNSGTSAISTPFRNDPAPGNNGFRRVTLSGAPASGMSWFRLTGRVSDAIVAGVRYKISITVRASIEGLSSSVSWRWHSGTAWLSEFGGTVTNIGTGWKVYTFEAVAPANAVRLDFDFGGNNATTANIGSYVDMAAVFFSEATVVNTDFFNGASPDEREADLWIDTTNNKNIPKRWDGSGWSTVTDQAAIDAAVTAAAADATAKADSARAVGLAAAEIARAAAGLAGSRGRVWFQPEQPPLGATYHWAGAQNNSPSIMKVDGLEVRRNAFPNPGAVTGTQLSGWAGTSPNVSTAGNVDAPWSKSGKAHRRTWTTVDNQSGDHSVSLGTAVRDVGYNTVFTVAVKIRVGGTIQRLNAVRVYSHLSTVASGAYQNIAASPQMAIMPGSEYTVWATGLAREDITSDFRMTIDPRPLADGDYLEISEVIVYPGVFDDAKNSWFWGDSLDDRAYDLWIDTDEGNTPKRWISGGWSAVTDEAAIAAATTAAAADATAKADAAKAAAIAAASDDATAKANAARVLAEQNAAADATAKTNAAKTALTEALTADAAAKIATAKQEALTAAAQDASNKAAAAQLAAEQASGEHAAELAATAQQAAIDAAAAEAARVAGLAETSAVEAARNAAVELANAAKAAAIDASALDASFKADEAERRAKVDAATAQARADKAVTDAAAAAGVADSKTKTLVQSAAPAAADRNAKVLWIDTTNNANTPKVWVSASNSWVARTDKVATDAASRAATAISDAANAAAAAGRAQTAADNAMTAAGSKTTILTSTSNPSGIAEIGTIWRKEDAQHNIIGTWRYVGGANPWQAELVSSEMIDNLDVGKLTATTAVVNQLVAEKIAAATASFQRVDAKNLFVTGTATLEEAVARRFAAETGTFMQLTTDQLVAGSASINDLVAQKIAAATATFQKVDVGNLTAVGANMSQAVIDKLVANTANFQKVKVENITATATATLNSVVAQRVAAATASFQTVDAKNLFVTGTASLTEVVARRLAAETGVFISVTTDQLTAGSANLGDAVAQKISAATATFQKVAVENITSTATANLNSVVAQRIAAGTASFQTVKVENITATASANLNTVVAQRVAAATASFQTVDAKNLFVTGTTSLEEAVAKRFAADTGAFIQLSVDQLTVSGTANMKDAVADRVFANLFSTRKLMANQVLIGQGGSLIGVEMDDPAWDDSTSVVTRSSTGGRNGGASILVGTSTALVGSYLGMKVAQRAKAPKLVPGATYRLSAWFRGAAAIPAGGARLYQRYYPVGSTTETDWFFGTPSSVGNEAAVPANTWAKIEGMFTVPEGAEVVGIPGVYTNTNTNVAVRFSDVVLQEAITPELVVEGGIIAKHITASEEMSAKIGRFLKLDVVDLVATGSAQINDLVVDKLFAQTFATRKLYAEQVVLGQPNNVLADPMFLDAKMLALRNQHSSLSVTMRGADYELNNTGTSLGYFRPLGVAQTPEGVAAGGWIPVMPGEVWEWTVSVVGVKGTGGWIKFVGRTKDGSGYANDPAASTTLPVGSGTYTVQMTIPSNCFWLMPEMACPAGIMLVQQGSMRMRQVIDNSLVVENGIVARNIVASEELSAKAASFMTLTAGQVLIGGQNNLHPDPQWDHHQRIVNISTSPGTSMYVAGGGNKAIRYNNSAKEGFLYPLGFSNAGAADKRDWISCIAGEKYTYSYSFLAAVANVVRWRVYANVLLSDGTIANIVDSWRTGTLVGSWTWEMPAKAAKFGITVQVQIAEGSTNGFVMYGGEAQRLVKLTDGELIVDGAITTKKLKVTEDMTVELLKAHKVLAGEIDVNSLAADTAFIGLVDAKIVKADMFTGKSFTGGTFTGSVFQTTTTANRGVQVDTNGIRAWNSSGTQTFGVTTAGAVTATGAFTATASGISAALTTQTLGSFSRPMLSFRTPNHPASGYSPMIFAEGSGAAAGSYGEGSLVLMSSEVTANTSGRSELVLRRNGEGGHLQTIRGANGFTGLRWSADDVYLMGKMGQGYANSTLRGGRSAGFLLQANYGTSITYAHTSPSINGRVRPIITVNHETDWGTVSVNVHSVFEGSFICRVINTSTQALQIAGVYWMGWLGDL